MAFVVISVVLSIAGQLLLEAQSRTVFEAQRTLEPVPDLAIDQLRADLRLAVGVERPLFGGWERGPLELLGHPAGPVVYDALGGRLVRRIERDEGGGERPLLEVTAFRWRVATSGAVDVEISYRERHRLRALRAGGDWDDPQWIERRRVVRVVPRGGGGARW